MEVLHKLEGLETTKVGIFVMPKERVAIHSTYWYLASKPLSLGMLGKQYCQVPASYLLLVGLRELKEQQLFFLFVSAV
jgi:hypothetical protein